LIITTSISQVGTTPLVTDGFKRQRRQEVPLWDKSLAADSNHSPLSAWLEIWLNIFSRFGCKRYLILKYTCTRTGRRKTIGGSSTTATNLHQVARSLSTNQLRGPLAVSRPPSSSEQDPYEGGFSVERTYPGATPSCRPRRLQRDSIRQ
jgi:hypothetical protein